MKKTVSITITIIFLAFIYLPNLRAEEAETPSPSTNPDEVTENLKKRLQDSLESTKQNIIEGQVEEPKAFVGTIQDLIQNTIEVKTKNGIRYAKIDEESNIVRSPGNSQIDLDSVRIEDFIIAMGYLENESTILSKRVIVSQTLQTELQKTTGMGKIKELSPYTITLESEDIALNLSSQTTVKNKSEILTANSLETGQEIIYTAQIDNEELDATNIMIISSPPTKDSESN